MTADLPMPALDVAATLTTYVVASVSPPMLIAVMFCELSTRNLRNIIIIVYITWSLVTRLMSIAVKR